MTMRSNWQSQRSPGSPKLIYRYPGKRSYENSRSYEERRRGSGGGGQDGGGKRRRYEERSRSYSPSARTSSSGSIDDEAGHFHGQQGSFITPRYEIRAEVGKGTFGKVFKCRDHKHGDTVALKVVRSIKRYIKSAQIEAKILDDIFEKQSDQDVNCCVKMFSHFHFQDHYVMVFEPLGLSLYELLKLNSHLPLPVQTVAAVGRQLLSALAFLQGIQLIHTDLKLENVLFVHSTFESVQIVHKGEVKEVKVPASPRIKLIDFGGATYIDDPDKSPLINTRQYRSPEVILELDWSYPSDIWSAACILGEIYTGDLLFATHDELEHLALIEKVCGQIPLALVDASRISRKYFNSRGRVMLDRLSRSSRDFLAGFPVLSEVFAADLPTGILDLIHSMLDVDPDRRITAKEALKMKFLC